MPIFQDAHGRAIKFFIQKDLPQQTQAELCETITSLGGRVEAKVPRQGYILVQLGTAEEERLRLCWTSSDRPERYFVSYTYVEACKVAGILLTQLFVENGAPIPMYIHPSVQNVNARALLSQRILHSGGDPHASIHSARVILADPQSDVFQHLVRTYEGLPDKYIESYLWVKRCIEKGTLAYTPMVYKNPGGRRPGEERTQFTELDEDNLCRWIAAKIPYKETGGRTGNRLYQQLCELAGEPDYAWVARHTWQSWRERYKKNAPRLDKMIAALVDEKKPEPGEKGQYGYVRQPEEKPKRPRKKKKGKSSTEESLADDEYAHEIGMVVGIAGPSQMVGSPSLSMGPSQDGVSAPPHSQPSIASLHEISAGGPYHGMMAGPYTGPLDRLAIRRSPDEEELEEDGPEWAVRVGNASPPAWGKRKAEDEAEDLQNKRARIQDFPSTPDIQIIQHVPPEHAAPMGTPLPTATLVAIANHVIDQNMHDIAKTYRFTFEEVQEFYDKCGDMDQTRKRFQRMRDELNAKFNDQ